MYNNDKPDSVTSIKGDKPDSVTSIKGDKSDSVTSIKGDKSDSVTLIKSMDFTGYFSFRTSRLTTPIQAWYRRHFEIKALKIGYNPIALRNIIAKTDVLIYWIDYETKKLYYGFGIIIPCTFDDRTMAYTLTSSDCETNLKNCFLEGFNPYQEWGTVDPYYIRRRYNREYRIYSQETRIIGIAVQR